MAGSDNKIAQSVAQTRRTQMSLGSGARIPYSPAGMNQQQTLVWRWKRNEEAQAMARHRNVMFTSEDAKNNLVSRFNYADEKDPEKREKAEKKLNYQLGVINELAEEYKKYEHDINAKYAEISKLKQDANGMLYRSTPDVIAFEQQKVGLAYSKQINENIKARHREKGTFDEAAFAEAQVMFGNTMRPKGLIERFVGLFHDSNKGGIQWGGIIGGALGLVAAAMGASGFGMGWLGLLAIPAGIAIGGYAGKRLGTGMAESAHQASLLQPPAVKQGTPAPEVQKPETKKPPLKPENVPDMAGSGWARNAQPTEVDATGFNLRPNAPGGQRPATPSRNA